MRHKGLACALFGIGCLVGAAAIAQAPPPGGAPPAAPPPTPSAPALPPGKAAPAPTVSLEPRVVRPRDITVISGSRFRVGSDRYQIFGIRSPRPRVGDCLMERLRGRRARTMLRRVLSRGEIRIAPTGQVNSLGDKIARVTVNGQSVRRRLIDVRAALPRRANENYNPWCIGPSRPPA